VTVWLSAAGYGEQIYLELCLQNNLILHGLGKCGEWSQENRARILECVDGQSKKTRHGSRCSLVSFCEKMQGGDIVVLRSGHFAHGVGVIGSYSYCGKYGSVGPQQWDLQHTRSVEWIWRGQKRIYDGTVHLPQVTTSRVDDPTILDWVRIVTRRGTKAAGCSGVGMQLPKDVP